MNSPLHNIKTVGIIANSGKSAGGGAVARAARFLREAGREVCADQGTAQMARLRGRVYPDAAAVAREADLLLVLGGDGTMLRVAREIAGSRTPMLGINIGSLGFLTAVPSARMKDALERVWRGEYRFESRALLEAGGCCRGTEVLQAALNDVVITRGEGSRLIEIDVRVDGQPLTRYRCDGLIISSPTGSTAYSLAAGGPVIYPTAEVLALTPICPHTLSNRALVLPLSARIELKVISSTPPTNLYADGQMVSELAPGDQVCVYRSRRTVRLLHLEGASFCETLRRKLHWRGTTLASWFD